MSIAVVAVTTEHNGDLFSTGVGTALRASTRAHDDDGASSSGTERDAAQSISVNRRGWTANSVYCIGKVQGSGRYSAWMDSDATCVGTRHSIAASQDDPDS